MNDKNPNQILQENPELIHKTDVYKVLNLTESGFYKRREKGLITFQMITREYYRTSDVRKYLKLDQ